jgi:hypothetical protein
MSHDLGQRIVAAANKLPCGLVVVGVRHCDDIMSAQAKASGKKLVKSVQGFIDNKRQFLTREEAWLVAEAAGQIMRLCGGENGKRLFSENLY